MELTAETRYNLLRQIVHANRHTLDLDETLNHLLDTLQQVLKYDAAGIFVLHQSLEHPAFELPQQLIAGIVRRGFDELPPEKDPMLMRGKGIIGHVIASGETIIAPDVHLDPHYIAGRMRTRSEIAVPIWLDEQVIGALNLESDLPDAFTRQDVDALHFFAEVAALSIEKVVLHRQLLLAEHIEEQLRTARQVQERLLPAIPPTVPGYDLAGLCLPAFQIGGDYFDFIPLSRGRIGLVAADVSGDGVPAALVMAAFRALLRTQARSNPAPKLIARRLNRLLPQSSGRNDFVTAFYAVLDPDSGILDYVRCGHPPALLCRQSGKIESLSQGGPFLGVFRNPNFNPGQTKLEPGDLLLLYTDGVVELEDSAGVFIAPEQLGAVLRNQRGQPAETVLQAIVTATRAHTQHTNYPDDFTLLALRRIS